MNQHVTIDRQGRIATITMNRPDKRNALSYALVSSLIEAFRELENEDPIRCIVLTGAGKAFSAGADLEALEKLSSATREENEADSRKLAELFRTIFTHPKVVIARVNGHAIAGGSGLAAVCDFAIADERARFGFTEVRIGFVPAIVMIFALRKLREADVRDLLLRGHLIDAETAADMGLINLAVESDDLDETVFGLAEEIAERTSSQSIALTKEMLARIASLPLDEALNYASTQNAIARESEDCQAGIRAFLAKKDPPWVLSQ